MKRNIIESKTYFISMLLCKGNHGREGHLFKSSNNYSNGFMKMHENCPVCGHPTEIESRFYYGTGNVSCNYCMEECN